jgi:multiple sugar transport system permease protein
MSSISGSTRSPRRFTGAGTWWAPYAFVLPFVSLFLLFLVTPIVVALRSSLYSVRSSGLGFGGTPETVFAGVGNYTRALADSDFIASFGRVLLYGVVQVPIMMVLAGGLALLFDSPLVKAKRLFQLIVFLPYAVPGVIAALLWGFLYQPNVSPLIQFFSSVGINANLLAPGTVLWSIANISLWSYTGINMIILFAALQSVPREMYEAAKLDGAGEVRIAFSIKLPMIWPAFLLTTLSSIIGTLQLFNEPSVLKTITQNISSAYTPNMAIFSTSTLGNNANLSSAMAVILGLATLIVSVVIMRLTTRRNGVTRVTK